MSHFDSCTSAVVTLILTSKQPMQELQPIPLSIPLQIPYKVFGYIILRVTQKMYTSSNINNNFYLVILTLINALLPARLECNEYMATHHRNFDYIS